MFINKTGELCGVPDKYVIIAYGKFDQSYFAFLYPKGLSMKAGEIKGARYAEGMEIDGETILEIMNLEVRFLISEDGGYEFWVGEHKLHFGIFPDQVQSREKSKYEGNPIDLIYCRSLE